MNFHLITELIFPIGSGNVEMRESSISGKRKTT